MPQERTLDDRLSALERSLASDTVGPPDTSSKDPSGESAARSEQLERRVESLESQLADLQAGLQAVRGYVGNIEHVNQSVERRANAAIAAVERFEAAPKTPPPIASAPDPEVTQGPSNTSTDTRESSDGETDDRGVLERVSAVL